MAESDEGDEVFQDCIEELPSEAPHLSEPEQPEQPEQPEHQQSSPAITSKDSAIGLDSPHIPPRQTIDEKHQAAITEYEKKRYVACRDKCMELLRHKNLPSIIRCQALQLFASCSYYYGAKHALEQALIIASNLLSVDPHQVLRKDVEEMLENLEQYRPEDGAPRAYIKEFEYDEN